MWMYRAWLRDGAMIYKVGFQTPGSMFNEDSEWGDQEMAALRVHYLNGGTMHIGIGESYAAYWRRKREEDTEAAKLLGSSSDR